MATKEKVQEMEAMEQEQAKVEEQAKVFKAGEADVLPNEDLPTDLDGMENTGLVVSRRQIPSTKKKGEMIWVYSIPGVLRGREVNVSLQATDIGGYSLLDLVFYGASRVPLWRKPFEVKDDKGVVTASGYKLFAVSIDEDTGIPYIAPLKEAAKSDKFLLETLIKTKLLADQRKEGE